MGRVVLGRVVFEGYLDLSLHSCSLPIPVRYLICSLPTISLPIHVRYLAFLLPVFFATLSFSGQRLESNKSKILFYFYLSICAYLQQEILKVN